MEPWGLPGGIADQIISLHTQLHGITCNFFSYFNVLMCCSNKMVCLLRQEKNKLEKNNLFLLSKNCCQSCFAYIYLLPAGCVFLALHISFCWRSTSPTASPMDVLDDFILLFQPLHTSFTPPTPTEAPQRYYFPSLSSALSVI